MGHPPMICVAQDTCKGKAIEDPILLKKLLELSDNKTEHLPGLLPFVPGMPDISTQNIATELGLINEQIFRVDVADILPKDKKRKSNQKTIPSIKRTALSLVPAYCITTHKSQAVYVPLSRVKRLIDLTILRPFDYKILLMKPNKSQVAEIERLDQLYMKTRLRFSEWFQ
ncbi:unnamed protein product [Adineta ricciae]|uniref:Uncharacterized protein n=1 Tax=Adineta ricciae TaxID=249248 RepID=A0A816G7Q8_ADIRI|nr:unnamed protein product [Adineta ricciae]CAF1670221.1 unnamed protein product [Adineta ricciae]